VRRIRPARVMLAACLVVALSYEGSAIRSDRDAIADRAGDAVAATPTVPLGVAAAPGADDELARLIRDYERRITEHTTPSDYRILGQLTLERARRTGDLDAYARATTVLRRALDLFPTDPEARVLLATARYAVHDFSSALRIASEVYGEDPTRLDALVVVGDAQLSLGRYRAAAESYGSVEVTLSGVPEVQVRLARLAFLLGDSAEARRLAESAARRAVGFASGPGLAWYRTFAAQVAFDEGRYRDAERSYREAIQAFPTAAPAHAGLGRTLAALGRTDEAIEQYLRATATLPDPGWLAALGDLYAITGQRALADRQYATVEAIASLARAGGQIYDRQLALFYADHGIRPKVALRLASRELESRRDVHGWDAYAWALFADGRNAEARAASSRALALGTPDANLWYHAGMISAALGDRDRAVAELGRALSLSPHFDPMQSRRARAILTDLSRGA
jgi:tetratricopeptide (TPR) repeat protein